MKLLFICKKRELTDTYPESYYYSGSKENSSGLYNSARLVAEKLNQVGVESVLVQALDNNEIDRLVNEHKPTHVIIEALWVVPDKFDILATLHPDVQWIIRLHSETPFLAGEGIAMDWIFEYMEHMNVSVAANSKRLVNELGHVLEAEVMYLPNFYGISESKKVKCEEEGIIKIGCFGAVRLLKNHLIQAFAAMKFANDLNRKLKFYINGTRIEMNGSEPLKNLRNTFKHHPVHELVELQWMPHAEFLEAASQMDIGLQVSFTETFNIVAADMVVNDIPVVVSGEVQWCSGLFKADPTNMDDIVKKLHRAWRWRGLNLHGLNKRGLKQNGESAIAVWVDRFTD
jgi:hypothetical protein